MRMVAMMMVKVTFITIIRFIIRYKQGRTSVKTAMMMMMANVTFITIIRFIIRYNRAAHQ